MTAKLASCLLVMLALPCAGVSFAADEIHWTIRGQSAVTFDWRGPENTLRYGLTSAYGNTATAAAARPVPISSPGPYWEAQLTGLQEDTVYHYSVGTGPDHTFRTPPPRGTSDFEVDAEADVGDGATFPRMTTIQSMIAAGAPRFVLVIGDITYANDFGQARVDGHFNDTMAWSQDAAYMPAWGNHEWNQPADDLRNYKGRFDFPNSQTSPTAPDSADAAGTPRPYGEDWYWFDYGNARFISIPEPYTYGSGGPWADWNNQARAIMSLAQQDPAIRFIVTFGHRPTYTSGNYSPGDLTLRGYLDALGAANTKYVLDLCGHSHDYERSIPQSRVTHVTVGVGGANLEGTKDTTCLWKGGCPPPASTAFRAMRHAIVRLRFTATTIEGQVLCGPDNNTASNRTDLNCVVGTVIDTFTIRTPASVSVPESDFVRIDRVMPNPATNGVSMWYSLRSWAPAEIELLDSAGRQVLRRSLGAPGPGTHVARLDPKEFGPPGVYLIRVRQAGKTSIAKVSIITSAGR